MVTRELRTYQSCLYDDARKNEILVRISPFSKGGAGLTYLLQGACKQWLFGRGGATVFNGLLAMELHQLAEFKR